MTPQRQARIDAQAAFRKLTPAEALLRITAHDDLVTALRAIANPKPGGFTIHDAADIARAALAKVEG